MPKADNVIAALKKLARKEKAAFLPKFFKTGKGEYGEGDIFWGVVVPDQRKVAREFRTLLLEEVEKLLVSPVHEQRLTALFILVYQYEKGDEKEKKKLFDFYLAHTRRVNNWDLVDSSAGYIVGQYLLEEKRDLLYRLATSKNLWERRIAMIATHAFIRQHQFADTMKLAELLLQDPHDLMHKAVGWMLREVGNRDESVLRKFLDAHASKMPRTMLRYAIEKLNEKKRKYYLVLRI